MSAVGAPIMTLKLSGEEIESELVDRSVRALAATGEVFAWEHISTPSGYVHGKTINKRNHLTGQIERKALPSGALLRNDDRSHIVRQSGFQIESDMKILKFCF